MKTTTPNEKNPVRIGILLEPLMEIFAHPDRNNLIRGSFAKAEEESILSPTQKRKQKQHSTPKRTIASVRKFPQQHSLFSNQ